MSVMNMIAYIHVCISLSLSLNPNAPTTTALSVHTYTHTHLLAAAIQGLHFKSRLLLDAEWVGPAAVAERRGSGRLGFPI